MSKLKHIVVMRAKIRGGVKVKLRVAMNLTVVRNVKPTVVSKVKLRA